MEFLRVSRRKNFFCNLVSLLLIFLTANKSLEGFGRVEVLSVFLNNCEASKRNEFFVLHGVSSIIALSKQYLFYTLSHFPVEPKFSKTRSCFFPTFDDILFFGWKKRKNENGWKKRKKRKKIFPGVAFLSHVVHDCLSKCPNSKKPHLPWKITGYKPEESLKSKVYWYQSYLCWKWYYKQSLSWICWYVVWK